MHIYQCITINIITTQGPSKVIKNDLGLQIHKMNQHQLPVVRINVIIHSEAIKIVLKDVPVYLTSS